MHNSISPHALLAAVLVSLAGCGSSAGDDTGTGTGTGTPTLTTTPDTSDPGTTAPTTSGTEDPTGAPTTSTSASETASDSTDGPITGDTTEPATTTTTTTTTTTGDTGTSTGTGDTTTGDGLWDRPNLWYAVDKALVYIEISPMDGSVVALVHNELIADVPLWNGQNGLTMLEDGSLLGSRESAEGTQIYHINAPSITADTPAMAVFLGVVPGEEPGDDPPRIEALYTDCDGRIYLMDTGVDVGSSEGNRLLRFNGDYLQGALTFDVITELGDASVADIDDMSPGIVDGEVSDGLGFAMDSSNLWQIDYTTGTGIELANTDGTWGVHALGGPLFNDLTPRLYILSSNAVLLEVYLNDYSSGAPLVTGPDLKPDVGYNGWSGLAGPLTECMTTIPG